MQKSPEEANVTKRQILSDTDYSLARNGTCTDTTTYSSSYSSVGTAASTNSSFRSLKESAPDRGIPSESRKPPTRDNSFRSPPKPPKLSDRGNPRKLPKHLTRSYSDSVNNSQRSAHLNKALKLATPSDSTFASSRSESNSTMNSSCHSFYVSDEKKYPTAPNVRSSSSSSLPRRLSSGRGLYNESNDVGSTETDNKWLAPGNTPTAKATSNKPNKSCWRCCAIIGVTSLAVIIGVVLACAVLIIPKVAQNAVDNSKLTITSLALSSPTTDPQIVRLQGNATLDNFALITETKGGNVMLVFEGKTIGSTTLPKQNLIAGQSNAFTLDSKLQISDSEAFRSFATAISERESVTFSIEQPQAQFVVMGFLPATARLTKSVTVQGLGLRSARVTFDLPSTSGSSAQNNGRINLEITMEFFNPSVISVVGVGFAPVALTSIEPYETIIGSAGVDAFSIIAGATNTIKARGFLNFELTGTRVANHMFARFMSGNSTVITATVIAADLASGLGLDFEAPIDTFASALQGVSVDVPLQPPPGFSSLLQRVEMQRTSFVLSMLESQSVMQVGATFSAAIRPPFKFPFTIRTMQTNFGIGAANSNAFLSLSTPTTQVDVAVSEGRGDLKNFEIETVNVQVLDADAVASFLRNLVMSAGAIPLEFSGTANAGLVTVLGDLSVTDISLGAVPFSLQGMNKLGDVTIDTFTTMNVNADKLVVTLTATMVNPSSVSLDLGRIGFNLVLPTATVGFVEGELSLKPGANTVQLSGELDKQEAMTQDLLDSYEQGQQTSLGLVGRPSSVASDVVKLAFKDVRLEARLPGRNG